MNQLFQNAIKGSPQNSPPIWFMRQAGRYHSHYQALRAKHTFEQLCRRPELATEVAMGPIEDFKFDVAILFSDILFPLDAMGLGLSYSDKGPALERKVRETKDVENLRGGAEAAGDLLFQSEALKLTRQALPVDKSLIGFVGGLWTLFVYAVEGGHSGSLIEAKKRISLFAPFLKKLVPMMQANIKKQLESGAEVVMIFDTAAGEVAPEFFRLYVAPTLTELASQFPGRLGYYSKGTQPGFFEESFWQAPWAGRGVDHRWNLAAELQKPRKGFLQGNFDQALLHLSKDEFRIALEEYLRPLQRLSPQQRLGWVSGLGHGVLPQTPEENVRFFVNRVREVFS